MVVYLLILIFIIVRSASVAEGGQFNKNYLSKDNCNNIKGIFVILIVFSHYVQYVKLGGIYDEPYLKLRGHLDQMVVAMFLFYSGYGMMKSIQKKGKTYINTIMSRRFPMVWGSFFCAVTIFLIVDILTGRWYPVSRILMAYTGWTSIGNSNWYIFATLILYILMFVSFKICSFITKQEHANFLGCFLFTLLAIGFVYVQMKLGRDNYCYNTIVLFPLGCWYGLFQDKIESFLMKNDFFYTGCALALIIVYCISYINRWEYGIEGYTVWAVAFTFVVLLITMKIKISSNILSWFGNHVFSIYVLQRIPMMLLSDLGFAEHKYMFLSIAFVGTVFIAMVFDHVVTQRIQSLFYRNEKWKEKQGR